MRSKIYKLSLTTWIVGVWCLIVTSLFLHTSSVLTFPMFNLPEAKGNIIFLKEYKSHNILGLGQRVIAIPHGVPFIHPARKKEFEKNNVHITFSINEAVSIIDHGSDPLKNTLEPLNVVYNQVFLAKRGKQIVGIPAVRVASGNPEALREWPIYTEKILGLSLRDAKAKVDALQN